MVVAQAVEQVQTAARGQEPLKAIPRQGAPDSPQHQQHQPGVHQQGADAPGNPLASSQPAFAAVQLPSLGTQQGVQALEAVIGVVARQGFSDGEFAELSWRLVIDPLAGGLECRPLAAPAAKNQGKPQPGEQGQKPAAGIDVIQLQLQHLIAIQQSQPGGLCVGVDVAGGRIALGYRCADGAGNGDQQQQHNGEPQIGEQGCQSTHQETHGLA